MSSHLVIQAPDIETQDLKTLHQLAQANGIEKIDGPFAHQAFRLVSVNADAPTRASVAAHCTRAALDFAFVDAERSWQDVGLIASDMDSTLITIECIDEIADFAQRKAEVAAVTEAAMRGEIDWPTSLRQRVAALAGLPECTLARVYEERLKLTPGAELLIRTAKAHGIKLLLVSGGFTFFTARLKERLGLDHAFSNELDIVDGKLTGRVLGPLCDADAKARHVRDIAAQLHLKPSEVIAMGDGANDLAMFGAAGMSVAYRAKPIVREAATVAFNHVGLDGLLALFSPR
jgi:phosphoserine phosphatase